MISKSEIINAINENSVNTGVSATSGECLGCFWLEKQLEPGVITTSISSQNYFDITVLSEFDCVSGCQGNKLEKIILKDHHLYGSNRLGYQEYNKALPLNNGNVVTNNFSSQEDVVGWVLFSTIARSWIENFVK